MPPELQPVRETPHRGSGGRSCKSPNGGQCCGSAHDHFRQRVTSDIPFAAYSLALAYPQADSRYPRLRGRSDGGA